MLSTTGLVSRSFWDIDPEKHKLGLVVHGSGWPLEGDTTGGFFLYHLENNHVAVGLIVDLNYTTPWLSPFDEFERLKHHPVLANHLDGGKRVAHGARAITKGGFNSLPIMVFPGGLLIGCNASTLNFSKIKGTHTAMKSGMLAGEAVFEAIAEGNEGGSELNGFSNKFEASWAYDELFRSRNFGPSMHKFRPILGGAYNFVDQNLFGGKLPITLHDNKQDYAQLKPADQCTKINYPKPDGKLSFDKLSSVFISNTNHEESQPYHLKLKDSSLLIVRNLPIFAEPA